MRDTRFYPAVSVTRRGGERGGDCWRRDDGTGDKKNGPGAALLLRLCCAGNWWQELRPDSPRRNGKGGKT
jgi:hypothetical protein